MKAQGTWHYADLCPTPAMLARVLQAIDAWEPGKPAPEPRALEVLAAIGRSQRTLLEEAARAESRSGALARGALEVIGRDAAPAPG